MNAGGETADQAVKMTLQGIEIVGNLAIQAGGMATKSLAATLYAIITDQKKVKGKTRLDNLLKSGKELKVFAIRFEDLEKFCTEAKRYGVLYSVLKEKENKDGICDIMVRAEDAAKISRIVDRFELATIDTRAVRESIMAQREGKGNSFKDVPILSDDEHDELVEMLMNSTKETEKEDQTEKRTVEIIELKENPENARTEEKGDNQFEPNSKKVNVADNTNTKSKRLSVREQLKEIKEEQKEANQKKKTQQRVQSNTKKRTKKKKSKRKVR